MNEHELREALAGHARPADVAPGYWADVEQRAATHRMATRRWRAVAVAAAVLAVVGVAVTVASLGADDQRGLVANEPADPEGGESTTVTTEPSDGGALGRSAPIDAVRTEPGDRTLVITFLGAAEPTDADNPCASDYRAEVTEGDTSVTVTVREVRRAPPSTTTTGEIVCTAEGHVRVVRAELVAPLGDRAVHDWTDDRPVPVYRAATMLEPTALPDGYRFRDEAGFDPSWTQWFEGPRGTIGIVQASPDEAVDRSGCTAVEVRGVTGEVCDDRDSFIVVRWVEDGYRREVVAFEEHSLTADELLAIAEGLRPLA